LTATGQTLAPPRGAGGDPWPPDMRADLGDVTIGLARTAPRNGDAAPVCEVLNLTLAAIAAARRTIFIENQYLTSAAVGEALAARLAEPDGPEVVAVLPQLESGWLEQSSMGILRARLLARLRQADHHGRLHVYYPVVPGPSGVQRVNVHSKVLVVDDRLLKIGSANMSNRSMGLDSECDLVIEAGEGRVALAIAAVRDRLLAEHLDVGRDRLEERMSALGSVAAAVESFRAGGRSLERLAEAEAPLVNLALFDGLVCDPEQPIAADKLIAQFVPEEVRSPAQRALRGVAVALAILVAGAVLWRVSPQARWLGAEELGVGVAWLRQRPEAPLLVLAAFLLGAALLVPGTLLIGMTVLLFPWSRGAAYALVASAVTAAVSYGLGRWLPHALVQRRWGPQTMWLRGQLRRGRVVPLALARLVPVGNFAVMGLVAGSLRVRFVRYMLGTAVGLIPGVLALTLITDRLAHALRNPGLVNVVLLALVLWAAVGAIRWLAGRLSVGAAPVRAVAR
jgi:phospholipase D1/2